MAINNDAKSTMTLAVRFTADVTNKSFDAAIKKLRNAVNEANKLVKQIAGTDTVKGSPAAKAVDALNKAISGSGSSAKSAGEATIKYKDAIAELTNKTKAYQDTLTKLSKTRADKKGMIDSDEFRVLKKNLDKANDSLISHNQRMGKTAVTARGLMSEYKKLNSAYQDNSKELDNYTAKYDAYQKRATAKEAKKVWNEVKKENPKANAAEVRKLADARMAVRIEEEQWKTKAQAEKDTIARNATINKQIAERKGKVQEVSDKQKAMWAGHEKEKEIVKAINKEQSGFLKGKDNNINAYKRQLDGVLKQYKDMDYYQKSGLSNAISEAKQRKATAREEETRRKQIKQAANRQVEQWDKAPVERRAVEVRKLRDLEASYLATKGKQVDFFKAQARSSFLSWKDEMGIASIKEKRDLEEWRRNGEKINQAKQLEKIESRRRQGINDSADSKIQKMYTQYPRDIAKQGDSIINSLRERALVSGNTTRMFKKDADAQISKLKEIAQQQGLVQNAEVKTAEIKAKAKAKEDSNISKIQGSAQDRRDNISKMPLKEESRIRALNEINRIEKDILTSDEQSLKAFKSRAQAVTQTLKAEVDKEATLQKLSNKRIQEEDIGNRNRVGQINKTAQAYKDKWSENEAFVKRINTLQEEFSRKGGGAPGDLSRQIKKEEMPIANAKAFGKALDYNMGKYPQYAAQLQQIHDYHLKAGSSIDTLRGAMAHEITTLRNLVPHQNKLTLALQDIIGKAKILASYAISGGIIYKIFGGLQAANTEIIQYDQALKNLQAITTATDEETVIMGETLKKTAIISKLSAKEIADGMTLIGQAGYTAAETVQIIGSAANLSTGTLEKMDVTVDLLTTTLTAFNMQASESSRVADVMANAVNKSKLTIEKLRVAFGYFGSLAHQAGMSLEQTAASMEILADHGLRASTIGTSLRQVVSRLITPNEALAKAAGHNADTLAKLNPLTVGWERTLKELSTVLWDEKNKVMDVGEAFRIFGLRGAQAAIIMANAYRSGEYEEYVEQLYIVGAANKMAMKQMEGLSAKLMNTANTWKIFAVELSELGTRGVMGLVLDSLKALGDLLIWIVKDPITKFMAQAVFWSAGLVGITMAFKALWVAASGWMAMTFLSEAMMGAMAAGSGLLAVLAGIKAALIASGWGVFVLATGAAITAIYQYRNANEEAALEAEKQKQAHLANSDAMKGAATALAELKKEGIDSNIAHVKMDSVLDTLIEKMPQYVGELEKLRGKYEQICNWVEKKNRLEAGSAIAKGFDELSAKMNAVEEKEQGIAKETITWADGSKHTDKIRAGINKVMGNTPEKLKAAKESLELEKLRMQRQMTDYVNSLPKEWGMEEIEEHLKQKIPTFYKQKMKTGIVPGGSLGSPDTVESEENALLQNVMGRVKRRKESESKNLSEEERQDAIANAKEALRKAKLEQTKAEVAAGIEMAKKEGGEGAAKRRLQLELRQLELEKDVIEKQKALDFASIGSKTDMDEAHAEYDAGEALLKLNGKISETKIKLGREGIQMNERLKTSVQELADSERELRATQRDSWKGIPEEIKAVDKELLGLAKRHAELDVLLKKDPNNKFFIDQLNETVAKQAKTLKKRDGLAKTYAEESIKNDDGVIASQERLMKAQEALAERTSQGLMSEESIKKAKEQLIPLEIGVKNAEIAATKAAMIDPLGKLSDEEKTRLRQDLLRLNNEKADLEIQKAKIGTEWSRVWTDIGQDAFNELSNGFANVISDTKSAKEAMMDFGTTMVNELMAIIAKLILMTTLMATIGQSKGGKNALEKMGVKDAFGVGYEEPSLEKASDTVGTIGTIVDFGSKFFGKTSGPKLPSKTSIPSIPSDGKDKRLSSILGSTPEFKSWKASPQLSAGKMRAFGGQEEALAGAGGYNEHITMIINATDAQSFSKMLATEPAQRMVSHVVTNKFAHNDSIRKTLRKR